MREHDVQWSQYPTVVNEPTARAWLRMQAEPGSRQAYG